MSRLDKILLAVIVAILFVLIAIVGHFALAQKATELYIPIGQSPGLSKEGKTVMGNITKILPGVKTFKIGEQAFPTNATTQFYIDRSHLEERNDYGKFEVLKEGTFVEVYIPFGFVYAEWVKIRGIPEGCRVEGDMMCCPYDLDGPMECWLIRK